jgi:iron complex transport system substrate-binding protein
MANCFKRIFYFLPFSLLFFSCGVSESDANNSKPINSKKDKIVTLNGTLTELLYAFNLGSQIVANDVTSTFPKQAAELPKVGHSRSFQAEGILMYAPDIIFGKSEEVSPELANQLKASGATLHLINQNYSVDGTKDLIRKIGQIINAEQEAENLLAQLDVDLSMVQPINSKPKALFIYARGAGTLLVAGRNTQMHSLIEIAGGENAFANLEGFKPLTAEALVQTNPDVIILFEKGLESLNGKEALAKIPGIRQTNAFKNNHFVIMDGQLASGFGPRLGKAAIELNQAFLNAQ